MAVDWLADVQKFDPDADPEVVSGIVRHCGIALQKKDSSLVSFSSPEELSRVRDSFLRKKLGRAEPNPTLDDAILSVGEKMKGTGAKNRVTVYHLLARHFGQLHLFDRAGSPGATNAVAGSPANDEQGGGTPNAASEPSRLGEAALPAGAGAGAATALHIIDSEADDRPAPAAAAPNRSYGGDTSGTASNALPFDRMGDDPKRGGSRWWLWLILGALTLFVLFALLRSCGHQAGLPSTSQPSAQSPTPQATGNLAGPAEETGNVAKPVATALTNEASPPLPTEAGVVAVTENGLPALKAYFDVGKSAVAGDVDTASKPLRDYVQAHPSAHVGVSGYNDPTGNAALNAALSKARAQNVAAALEKAGLPASAVVLEKPANATSTSTGFDSRRVDVVVRQ